MLVFDNIYNMSGAESHDDSIYGIDGKQFPETFHLFSEYS